MANDQSMKFASLTPQQLTAALRDRTRCPCCRSENLTFEGLDWTEEGGVQRTSCTDCGRAWELVMAYTEARPTEECCGACREAFQPDAEVVVHASGECVELLHSRCRQILKTADRERPGGP